MQIVDWDFAAATASRLVPPGPKLDLAEATAIVDDLRARAVEAEQHVAGYTGLPAGPQDVGFAVVDRPAWIRSNVEGFAALIDPLVDTVIGQKLRAAGPVMTVVGPRATAVEVGGLLAFLSTRVLGQFEIFGPPGRGARLLLVAPNIVAAERALGADERDFRLWVCLHEVTHRTQFAAAPWLHDHVRSLLQDYLQAADLDTAALLGRLSRGVRELVGAARGSGGETGLSVLELVQTPAQGEVLDRVTGLMSLLEGHADVVMDGVGPQVVPSVQAIRSKFERRRNSGSGFDKAIRRLLGLDMKMRQYAEGAAFVRAVIDAVGMAGLNRVWSAPELLPTGAEIRRPQDWLARTGAPGAAA